MTKKISIIGGGNLGTAIAEGLVQSGFVSPENIMVTRRNIVSLQPLSAKGVQVSSSNAAAVEFGDYVILAVKPFQLADILAGLEGILDPLKHTIISVITGVGTADILQLLKSPFPVVRAMPNTAIAIQQSMTCISYKDVAAGDIEEIMQLFSQLGKVVVIEEKLMDAATVLGACGTAFAMRYIRANIQGGIEIGFDAATANLIAAQTVKGAAELLLVKGSHPEQEIDKVTTPKGCTIAGLNEMEHQGFSSSLIKGIMSSYQKIAKD